MIIWPDHRISTSLDLMVEEKFAFVDEQAEEVFSIAALPEKEGNYIFNSIDWGDNSQGEANALPQRT